MEDHLTVTATAALLGWPVVTLLIFASVKPVSRALIWSLLAAQLLLPVGASIKFQMVPPIDKMTVASFSALACCIFFAARRKRSAQSSRFGLVEILLLLNVVCPIITSELNSDNIIIGDRFLPGVGLYDAISAAESTLIALIPFLLGRRFLRTQSNCHDILVALAVSGLIYSVPLLFEIRFSPQLHYWTYGYYPSEFVQAIREGGFRPMVFMGHGLLAAFFLMTSLLSATALWRNQVRLGLGPPSAIVTYLGLVLLLCKSVGALLYGVVGGALVFLAKPKTQFRVATILVTISLTYPLLRSFDLFPTKVLVDIAKSADAERAQSLEFRFDNEDRLLTRAFERPLFGWGRFGRNRVYEEESGNDISVTDGRWIIDIGQFGLIGFLAGFGLLSICVYRSAAAFRLMRSTKEQVTYGTLTLILAINILDLLPNSGLIPLTWLLAGALLGNVEALALNRRPSKIGAHPNSSAVFSSGAIQADAPGSRDTLKIS